MVKKTITYTDYDGEERTEDFRFNLTESELTEMNLSMEGGLQQQLELIVSTKDYPKLVAFFKSLLLKSYGEKSLDGRRFIKSEKLSEEFSQTPAFDIMFMTLAQNADEAAKFVNGIVPASIREAAGAAAK